MGNDYCDNDDSTYTSVMGRHIDNGTFVLPDYEDSIGRAPT